MENKKPMNIKLYKNKCSTKSKNNINNFIQYPTIPHMNKINTIHTRDLVIEFDSQNSA